MQLDLQLSELKDKYRAVEIELRTERSRARQSRSHVARICGEIYQVSKITEPARLLDDVKRLYHKYSDSSELQKSLALDAKVEEEFQRQRDHLEKVAAVCKSKIGKKNESVKISKLKNENVILLEELNTIRQRLKETQKQNSNLESLLGLGAKGTSASQARKKLEKAFTDFEEYDKRHKSELENSQKQIDVLSTENQTLHHELSQINQPKLKIDVDWMDQVAEDIDQQILDE